MKKTNKRLLFILPLILCLAFNVQATNSDREESDAKPASVVSQTLSAIKETAKFYAVNPHEEGSPENQVVSIGRQALVHFIPLDGLSTGDGQVARFADAGRFVFMGLAIQEIGHLIAQEEDLGRKTILQKTRLIFSAHLLFDALISLSEYAYGEEAYYSVTATGTGALLTAFGCFYMLYILSNIYDTRH